ncbi:hypothetical protein Droror1_Dr00010551 [Drosera rotundifolia]
MAWIPMDLIVNVLARMPVKSLMRFKCVSRSWYDLISDRGFVQLHLKRSLETNSRTSIVIGNQSLYSLDLENINSCTEIYNDLGGLMRFPSIVGSCNGLLCLAYNDPKRTLVLYNPYSRMYKKVPPSSNELKGHSLIIQNGNFGFGYDSAHDDFKIVSILQFPGMEGFGYRNAAYVYSMNNDSWESIEPPPCLFLCHATTPALVNGVLYWIGVDYPGSYSYCSVVGFSLSDQSFVKVPPPQHYDICKSLELGELSGCLSLQVKAGLVAHVWMMKGYGAEFSWIKLCSISIARFGDSWCGMKSLAYSRNGRELFFWWRGKGLFSYDLEEKSFKKVEIPRFPTTPMLNDAMLCIESLVQPSGGCFVTRKQDITVVRTENGIKGCDRKLELPLEVSFGN